MKLRNWMAEHLIDCLEKHNGNKSKVAKELEFNVKTIRSWCFELFGKDKTFIDFKTDEIKIKEKAERELRTYINHAFPTNEERIKYLDNPETPLRDL